MEKADKIKAEYSSWERAIEKKMFFFFYIAK